jgi:hypothetical protein
MEEGVGSSRLHEGLEAFALCGVAEGPQQAVLMCVARARVSQGSWGDVDP